METIHEPTSTANMFKQVWPLRDYYKICREVLRLLRGELSQRQLSEKLGYTFNQVGKWESGVTQIKWEDFIQINHALGLPVDERLQVFFGNGHGPHTSQNVKRLFSNWLALDSIDSDVIRNKLKKWKASPESLDLAEALMAMDSRPAMLFGFLSHFVNCAEIEILRQDFENFEKEMNLLSAEPLVGFINEALLVEDYRRLPEHDDEVLAFHASCTVDELKPLLEKLVQMGVVGFDGHKYFSSPTSFSFSTLSNKSLRKFNKFTFEWVAKKYPLEILSKNRPGVYNVSGTSTRVVAISRNASEEIDRLVSQFHNAVGEVVKNDSQPKENVQIISLANVVSTV
ncbi:MAG: helix-turn-helix transcriptional regulator [Pseudobdellovibrionaceae bacterium]|nr:helix-turn-helix transcriptional regulator [Bdellovibrionales bacterium]USN47780.1 MAG: helix-turn-helix transcriptional regulator [Pseudobdellovibrionaceae bacterium]